MESSTQTFFQRTWGFGSRTIFVIGAFGIGFGLVALFTGRGVSSFGTYQFFVLGILLLFYSRILKKPFIIIDDMHISVRRGMSSSYVNMPRRDLEVRVDEKSILLKAHGQKDIRLPRWLFNTLTWRHLSDAVRRVPSI